MSTSLLKPLFLSGGGTVSSSDILDSTAAGRALLTAANAAAQRTAIGVGFSQFRDETVTYILQESLSDSSAAQRINSALNALSDAGILDELVDAVKGLADGMTFIYLNRRARRYLNALKDTKLSLAPADRNYTTQIAEWDSIPVILDESIVDTETTDLD